MRLATKIKHTTQRRVEENRRALQLDDISEVAGRHLAELAYNLVYDGGVGNERAAANEAAEAAAATGDLRRGCRGRRARQGSAMLDGGDGGAGPALCEHLKELCALVRTSDAAPAHDLAAIHYATLLTVVGQLDDAAAQAAAGRQQARRAGNAMALEQWGIVDGVVHTTAGRLIAARAAVEFLPPPPRTGATEPDMIRMEILAEVAARTDNRTLLQQMVNDARDAYSTGSWVVRRGAARAGTRGVAAGRRP